MGDFELRSTARARDNRMSLILADAVSYSFCRKTRLYETYAGYEVMLSDSLRLFGRLLRRTARNSCRWLHAGVQRPWKAKNRPAPHWKGRGGCE